MTNRRSTGSKTVILEKKRRGHYLVYEQGGYNYLVFSEYLRINKNNPDFSNNFEIIQPAIVTTISSGQTWELQERGILQF